MKRLRAGCSCLAGLILLTGLSRPANTQNPRKISGAALADMTLEQLMSLQAQVTSASKKSEDSTRAPAAIFVITSEDIRRGGFSSLPEALRLVPGLYVARVSAHWWTISTRGFNDYANNKMLVLIDGRSVYTPQFGGVFWELQDMPLEDIDRIEVIRGPGGTLWGSNAVNGVINVITKNSAETQGLSATVSASTGETSSASVRYGDRLGRRATYRVFGKATYFEPGINASGGNVYEFMNLSQGGMRLDAQLSAKDDLTFESGLFNGRLQTELMGIPEPGALPAMVQRSRVVRGGYVLSRWNHAFSGNSQAALLAYCDWEDRTWSPNVIRNICRVELQHDLRINQRHSLIWGLNFESSAGTLYESFAALGTPARQHLMSTGTFAQYDFELIPDRLRLIAGTKFEHNSYTGFEFQPQIRAVWTPGSSHTFWSAVSRAVRLPTWLQNSEEFKVARLPAAAPTYLTAAGNPELGPETLRAYEAGYRFNPSGMFSFDAAFFYNHYEGLINLNLVTPLAVSGPPRIHTNPFYAEIAVPWQNIGPGQTHGMELYAKFQPVQTWLLAAGITELRGNSVNLNDALNLPMANSTRHQFSVHSRWNVTSRIDFDTSLYHYNGIAPYKFNGITLQDTPTHNRVDAGLSFRAGKGLTLSIWGHDIGAGPHWENRTPLFTTGGSQTRGQSLALQLMWQPDTEVRR